MSPIAQVCLYGTRDVGFAYLASGPELSSPIGAKGGWNADGTRPSGHYLSLTEIIDKAKADLRALGIRSGEVLVFFPGGERCARTPVDEAEAVGGMKLEAAPVVVVTAAAIENAAEAIATTSTASLPALAVVRDAAWERYEREKASRGRARWRNDRVAWFRSDETGAQRTVELRRGDPVWATYGPSSTVRGQWGLIEALSYEKSAVKVGGRWFDLPLVYTRAEATTHGVPAPDAKTPAGRAIRELDRFAMTWRPNYVSWHRPNRDGELSFVNLIRGDLVWASFGGSRATAGTWGRVQGFSKAQGKVQVGSQWFDLPLVFMRQEAIAIGVTPPVEGDAAPDVSTFALLVASLRSRVSYGRILEIVSTDATPHTMRITRTSSEVGTLIVHGRIKETDSTLVIPVGHDEHGNPTHQATLRKGSRSYRVDPRRIRFKEATKPRGNAVTKPRARAATKARSK